MNTGYVQSFEQMLEVALAADSVEKARPMTDLEIQYLVATLRKRSMAKDEEKDNMGEDLEQTLFNMIALIRSEPDEEERLRARKLLRRISEVAVNMDSVNPGVIH